MTKGLLISIVAGTLTLASGLDGCAGRNLDAHYINLPGGYKATNKEALKILETLAGIYAGTIQLGFERENGIFTGKAVTRGEYNINKNPQSMRKVVSNADENGDKIISYSEANRFQRSFYNLMKNSYLNSIK